MIVTVTREQATASIRRWAGQLTLQCWARPSGASLDDEPVCLVCAVGAIMHDAVERALGKRPSWRLVAANAEENALGFAACRDRERTLFRLSDFFESSARRSRPKTSPPRARETPPSVQEIEAWLSAHFPDELEIEIDASVRALEER